MKAIRVSLSILPIVILVAGCNVNKDISVPDGAHWSSGSSTINGEITVGAHAIVNGGLRTINGSISVAPRAEVGDLTVINGSITLSDGVHAAELQSVNGDIRLGKQAVADGDVRTVNGSIETAAQTRIQGSVYDVNGDVTLCDARVRGNISFYNGTVQLAGNSIVQGNIAVKKPNGNGNNRVPYLIVGSGASVGGTISFERPGELYVSDSAVIHGVQGATPVRFSGATPAKLPAPNCPNN
ncbi:MAG: hypothetical protein WBR15_08650 [Gammaproteobacteria bacterium]